MNKQENELYLEIENWKPNILVNRLKEIKKRCLVREKKGLQKYPTGFNNPINNDEIQQQKDYKCLCHLKTKKLHKMTKQEKKIYSEIENWKNSSRYQNILKPIANSC